MTIRGWGVPKVCANCNESYWEEMTYGEDAYCGKYNMLCTSALAECELICIKYSKGG